MQMPERPRYLPVCIARWWALAYDPVSFLKLTWWGREELTFLRAPSAPGGTTPSPSLCCTEKTTCVRVWKFWSCRTLLHLWNDQVSGRCCPVVHRGVVFRLPRAQHPVLPQDVFENLFRLRIWVDPVLGSSRPIRNWGIRSKACQPWGYSYWWEMSWSLRKRPRRNCCAVISHASL